MNKFCPEHRAELIRRATESFLDNDNVSTNPLLVAIEKEMPPMRVIRCLDNAIVSMGGVPVALGGIDDEIVKLCAEVLMVATGKNVLEFS